PTSMAAAMCSLLDGAIPWMRGHFATGVGFFQQAVPGWEFFTGGSGQALLLLGTAYGLADRFEEARETLEAARTDLERRGMLAYLVEHHWFLANVHFITGRWDDSLAEMAASRQLTAETGI